MRSPLALAAVLALAACEPEPMPVPDTTFEGELVLVDDGAVVAGFAAFRDTLLAVAARRDTAAALALVADGARLSFGDAPGGPDGLRAMWFAGDPPEGRSFWDVLTHVLGGGSIEEDGAVVAPAVAALWPDDLDPYESVAVPGDDVEAVDRPGGAVVATLSRIVLPRAEAGPEGWEAVVLPDGRTALVPGGLTYSPVGYRLTAWDDGAGWRLQALVSGD